MSEIVGAIFDEIRYMQFVFLLLALVALWGALRAGPRRSAKPAVVALLLLVMFSWQPTTWAMNAILEYPYRNAPAPPADIDAIVLYSGGSFEPSLRQPFTYLDSGTTLRCRTAAEVYRASGGPPVLVCGGAKGDASQANPVWDVMARDLEAWGVDERRIRIEPEGRSTYEQALHAADILREMGAQRVAVVTEGFHMRRAAGCLERQGFEVFPAPAGSRGVPDPITWRSFVPTAATFTDSEEAIRETLAVLVYKLRGRI